MTPLTVQFVAEVPISFVSPALCSESNISIKGRNEQQHSVTERDSINFSDTAGSFTPQILSSDIKGWHESILSKFLYISILLRCTENKVSSIFQCFQLKNFQIWAGNQNYYELAGRCYYGTNCYQTCGIFRSAQTTG